MTILQTNLIQMSMVMRLRKLDLWPQRPSHTWVHNLEHSVLSLPFPHWSGLRVASANRLLYLILAFSQELP
jgi:hypothetical protein